MTDEEVRAFAVKHIATWNSHDLDEIMAEYSDTATLTSPVAAAILGSSEVRGKAALRDYFARALDKYPDLHFELIDALRGETSITLYFRSMEDRRVADVLFIDPAGRIERVLAHYAI